MNNEYSDPLPPNITITERILFKHKGDFNAYHKAEEFLTKKGYILGSMEMDFPIGFAPSKKYKYISKWNNMRHEEHLKLSGAIVGDKRNGPVKVVFYSKL